MIQDSGDRTHFESGAVRDLRTGKGRMDLCPLDVLSVLIHSPMLNSIDNFMHAGYNENQLYEAMEHFCKEREWDVFTAILEVSKHYEEGCKKYGDFNWQLGIPLHCYIDSACRHYIKWRRGDTDEPHDRAVIWNLLGAIWTFTHKPELDDIETRKVKE